MRLSLFQADGAQFICTYRNNAKTAFCLQIVIRKNTIKSSKKKHF